VKTIQKALFALSLFAWLVFALGAIVVVGRMVL